MAGSQTSALLRDAGVRGNAKPTAICHHLYHDTGPESTVSFSSVFSFVITLVSSVLPLWGLLEQVFLLHFRISSFTESLLLSFLVLALRILMQVFNLAQFASVNMLLSQVEYRNLPNNGIPFLLLAT